MFSSNMLGFHFARYLKEYHKTNILQQGQGQSDRDWQDSIHKDQGRSKNRRKLALAKSCNLKIFSETSILPGPPNFEGKGVKSLTELL